MFRGREVVDGTGNPWFVDNVAVRGDKIVAVAPGFIDIHSHSDLLADPRSPRRP